MEYTYIHNHQSQFIEMFEGDKYPHKALDSIAADWLKGQSFKKDEIKESGIHSCIHYGELFTKYGPVISQVQSYTSSEPKRLSKSGDILFPASDVTPNGLARCSMLPFDDVILGGDIIILRPKEDFNSGFLSYAINNQTYQLLTRVNGGVVKHMSSKSLKSVLIPIPPMDKQEEYIGIAHQADKSKFDGFKSQFIEMLDSVESFSALENIVSDTFPGEWGNEPTSSNAIKVIRTTNFTNEGRLDLSEVVTREIDSKKVSRKKLKKGDTILERSGGTKDNPVGRVVFFDEDGDYLFNNFTQVLRPKENVNPVYLFYSLYNSYNLNKAAMRAMASQTTGIQNLSMSDYMAKQIKLPSKKLQDKFESIYRQSDKSKYYEINETSYGIF